MESLSSLLVPAMLAGTALFAMGRKVDVYSALTHGAEKTSSWKLITN